MFDFRNWISEQKGPYTLSIEDHNHYKIETEYGISEINFYQIENDEEVVELRNTCKKTDTTKFFLHFQPVDEEHCKELFNEMISSLLSLKDVQTTRVLLFCTAGLTTSFFAEKLNDISKILEMDYVFHAVSVNDVYACAKDYDVILIAPQVAYEEKNLRERIPDKLILRIPTAVFATYNANGCIEFVRDSLKEYRSQKKKKKGHCCSCKNKLNKGKFLVIAAAPSDTDTRINYRVYYNGEIVEERAVMKRTINLKDLEDIIEVQVLRNREVPFDSISIAVPGIIAKGRLDLHRKETIDLQGNMDNLFNLSTYFEKKTGIPVVVENNANCAALGWYRSQDQYENICFMSLPNGWLTGGQGIIVNGKLVRGAHGIAGELRYVMNQMHIDNPLTLNPYHLDTVRQIVTKSILLNISIMDPEVVVVRCEMLPYPDEIKEELKKYLPEDRIPEIVHIDDFNDCVMNGQYSLCQNYFKEKA